MYKRLKVKLYPTKNQTKMLENHFDGYRYCYNLSLEYKQVLWNHHKISTQLVREYDTICIEDLSVESMLKEKKMSSLITDASWRTLRTMLEYKCDWYGKNLSVIGRFEPSSKRCNHCGNINKDLKLSDREWDCQKCQRTLDRDLNASLNIKFYGLGHQPTPLNVGQ